MSHSDYKSLRSGYLDNTLNHKRSIYEGYRNNVSRSISNEKFELTNSNNVDTTLFKIIKRMKDNKRLTPEIIKYLGGDKMVDYIVGKAVLNENSDYFVFYDNGNIGNIGTINLIPSIPPVPDLQKTNGNIFNISANNNAQKYTRSSICPRNIVGLNYCLPLNNLFILSPVDKITKEPNELKKGDRFEHPYNNYKKGEITGSMSNSILDDNKKLISSYTSLFIKYDGSNTQETEPVPAEQLIHENYLINNYIMDPVISCNLICTHSKSDNKYKYYIDIKRDENASDRLFPQKRLHSKIIIEDETEQNQTWKKKEIEIFIFPRDRDRFSNNDMIAKILKASF
jgi:hypothetical protein